MTTTRRGFLGAMLAAATAPALVRADSLMQIVVPRAQILTLWGDGVRDDTAALQAILAGASVMYAGTRLAVRAGRFILPPAKFKVSDTLMWTPTSPHLVIDSSAFVAAPEMPLEKTMLFIEDGANGSITNCHFNRGLQVRA